MSSEATPETKTQQNPMSTPTPNIPTASPEVKEYQRQKITLRMVNLVIGVAYLGLMAFVVSPNVAPMLAKAVGDSPWIQLLVVAIMLGVGSEVLSLPISFYSGYILEHRFGLSNQTLLGWLGKKIKGYLVGGILGLILLLGFYAMLWNTGSYWWLWTALAWLGVTLILGRIMPVLILPLFYNVEPLDDEPLKERLKSLAKGTGLEIEGVYRLGLSKETKKANAALAGLGKSRRVLLGDTLLEKFTPEEIAVVFAHEIGHHVHKHIPKMILFGIFTTMLGFWLVDLLLRQGTGTLTSLSNVAFSFKHPAALPLVLFVLSVFGLILSPLENALSRFHERQCDRYALERTGLHDGYRSAFVKLATMNKSDPDPHPLVVWLLHDHPPIRERISMAG